MRRNLDIPVDLNSIALQFAHDTIAYLSIKSTIDAQYLQYISTNLKYREGNGKLIFLKTNVASFLSPKIKI